MKTIIAIVTAGLGNRLMGLIACQAIAKKIDARVLVVWPEYQDCNVKFTELFTEKSSVSLLDKETAKNLKNGPVYRMVPHTSPVNLLPPENIIPGFPELDEKIAKINYFHGINDMPLVIDDLRDEETIFVWPYHFIATDSFTREELALKVPPLFWELSPAEQVLNRVKDFERANKVSDDYFTLHVRRPYTHRETPKQELKHSAGVNSDEEYLELAGLILKYSGKKLFICSNDPNIEKKAKSMFGKSVLTFEKISTMNNNPLAIIDAMAEMLIISRSVHTFASSSFSTFGANLGKDPLSYTWIEGGKKEHFEKARDDIQKKISSIKPSFFKTISTWIQSSFR